MHHLQSDPLVSIVIASHERPSTLRRLLLEIKAQDYLNLEVIIVDDNSSDDTWKFHTETQTLLDERFKMYRLPAEVSRKSPGVTRNYGVDLAKGEMIAFCDDDDRWINTDHIKVAVSSMRATGASLFLANMQTSLHGKVLNPDWYQLAWRQLARNGRAIGGLSDIFLLDRAMYKGFFYGLTPHVNTLVMTRRISEATGPFWNRIVFAEDHDWMFRLFDKADKAIFRSSVVAELDVTPHQSVAHSFGQDEKSLFEIAACLHAAMFVSHPALRRRLRLDRASRLLMIAESLLSRGQSRLALDFSADAFRLCPTRSATKILLRSIVSHLSSASRMQAGRTDGTVRLDGETMTNFAGFLTAKPADDA